MADFSYATLPRIRAYPDAPEGSVQASIMHFVLPNGRVTSGPKSPSNYKRHAAPRDEDEDDDEEDDDEQEVRRSTRGRRAGSESAGRRRKTPAQTTRRTPDRKSAGRKRDRGRAAGSDESEEDSDEGGEGRNAGDDDSDASSTAAPPRRRTRNYSPSARARRTPSSSSSAAQSTCRGGEHIRNARGVSRAALRLATRPRCKRGTIACSRTGCCACLYFLQHPRHVPHPRREPPDRLPHRRRRGATSPLTWARRTLPSLHRSCPRHRPLLLRCCLSRLRRPPCPWHCE